MFPPFLGMVCTNEEHMAKKRPTMSVELSKAQSSEEVAEIIGNAWIGYGLGDTILEDGDTATITIDTMPKTWKTAQKALWLKPKDKEGKATIYRMYNMAYELVVTVTPAGDDETEAKHTVLIRPLTKITTKEDSPIDWLIRLLHLAGQHNQKRHGSRYGSVAQVKRSLRALGDDPESRQGYRQNVRKRAGLTQKTMPSKDRKQLAEQGSKWDKPDETPKPKPEDITKYTKVLEPGGGVPVDSFISLDLPKSGKYGPNVREAIESIRNIHGWPEEMDTNIPIKLSNSKRALGTYYHQSAGRLIATKDSVTGETLYTRAPVEPLKIVVMRNNDHPRMTTAHEMGHYFDHQGRVGNVKREKGVRGSEQAVEQVKKYRNMVDMYGEEGARKLNKEQGIVTPTPMDGVMSAITNSKAYQKIEQDKGKEYKYEYWGTDWSAPRNPDGTRPKIKRELTSTMSPNHANYLQQPKEAFARAYSQYVAVKSPDPKIKEELTVRQKKMQKGGQWSDHWDDDDFKPIEKALDDFFISTGLAREKK